MERVIVTDYLVWGIYVLTVLPIWATAGIMMAVVMLSLHFGRDYFEGLPYNVAYSSAIGDAGLIVVTLIAATILQKGGVHIPEWLRDVMVHATILLAVGGLSVIVCVITLGSRSGQSMDIYHDVVIAPLLAYLMITLVPIIWLNGTSIEIVSTFLLIILWAAFVFGDICDERMSQRTWLQKHGVAFKKKG
jgi:hypothetical protein